MQTVNQIQSSRAFHPGELIKDELLFRAIKQKDFALRRDLSYTVINEILNAKRPIPTEFALMIEAALGISADVLVRMQSGYNLQMARENRKFAGRLAEIRKMAALL